MDARYESKEQELLNHLIKLINDFIATHLDEFASNENLRLDMIRIAEDVYLYAHTRVDVSAILRNKNFLSIDPVTLPSIQNITLQKEGDNPYLVKLITDLKTMLTRKNQNQAFYHELQHILDWYR